MALNKKNRLKKKSDFDIVFKKGKSARGTFLFVKFAKNNLGLPRFAFVVPSKVSKKAVTRNTIRRILSETVRPIIGHTLPFDIVVVTGKNITEAPREKIKQDMLKIMEKIR